MSREVIWGRTLTRQVIILVASPILGSWRGVLRERRTIRGHIPLSLHVYLILIVRGYPRILLLGKLSTYHLIHLWLLLHSVHDFHLLLLTHVCLDLLLYIQIITNDLGAINSVLPFLLGPLNISFQSHITENAIMNLLIKTLVCCIGLKGSFQGFLVNLASNSSCLFLKFSQYFSSSCLILS